ncbi:MAG: arabinose operon transcriptional regulator AraC [Planctomycetota bacterium]
MRVGPVEPDGPFDLRLNAGCTDILAPRHWDVDRPHGMQGWIIQLTSAGHGRLGPQARRLQPGDLLLFAPSDAHDYGRLASAETWCHHWIYFRPRSHWRDWLEWPGRLLGIRHQRRADWPQLQTLFEACERDARSAARWSQDLAANNLERLLLLCAGQVQQPGSQEIDQRSQRLAIWLTENHEEQRPVEELASEFGLSGSRLAHLFKRDYGVSPQRFRDQQRLQRAQALLRSTGMPVQDIAERVGYADARYFSRVFKREFGLSPRRFRQRSG